MLALNNLLLTLKTNFNSVGLIRSNNQKLNNVLLILNNVLLKLDNVLLTLKANLNSVGLIRSNN